MLERLYAGRPTEAGGLYASCGVGKHVVIPPVALTVGDMEATSLRVRCWVDAAPARVPVGAGRSVLGLTVLAVCLGRCTRAAATWTSS